MSNNSEFINNRNRNNRRRKSRRRKSSRRRGNQLRERAIVLTVLGIALLVTVSLMCFEIFNYVSKKVVKAGNETQTEIQEESVLQIQAQSSEKEDVKDTIESNEMEYPKMSDSYTALDGTSIKSAYVSLISVEDNKIVAGKDCETRMYPASMTKVMTLIVAVEHIQNLQDTYKLTSEMIDPLVKQNASRAGFDPGEEVNAKDLLYGLILPSGADAAVALADMVAGSEESFVQLMNDKCAELGLKNTHFMNPTGLHGEDHYTTPTEMAMIMEYAMKNATCAEVLSTYQYTTAVTEKHPQGILLTSTTFSRMVGDEVEGAKIMAGKTGYTQEAGHCLVTYGQKGDKHYVAVISGAPGKWDAIYDHFELYKTYAGTEK